LLIDVLLIAAARCNTISPLPSGSGVQETAMSDQPPDFNENPLVSRRRWWLIVAGLVMLTASIGAMITGKWDADERAKQRERLKGESERLQQQLDELQRQVADLKKRAREKQDREKQDREKQRPPEKAKPKADDQKSGRLDGLLTPVVFS
jgi:biopolymer transport protein ExbB/TolQ